MPDYVLLIVVGSVLLLGILITLMWIISSKISQRFSELNIATAERLSNMQTQLHEKIGSSSESFGQLIQQSLQTGRVEQHNVLQQSVRALEQRIGVLQNQMDQKLSQTMAANRQNLSQVTDRLSKLHEATGQIVALSKEVNELHTLMKAPALRGAFGEWTLEKMLEDVLGQEGHIFKRQFTLSSGERADAAIFTQPKGNQVVCIDSKFPTTQAQLLLGNGLAPEDRRASERQFAKDVLVQAKAIANKYIHPPKTLDFAFMFIPTESIFQLLLQQHELHEKLLRMNVIPTSPNSFYAYLQAMAFALRGLKIQESAREIQKQVSSVVRDFETFTNDYDILGTHLHRASAKYEETLADINRFQNRVSKLQSLQKEEPDPAPDPGEITIA